MNYRPLDHEDDDTLGLELRRGNEAALETLMRRHKNWIANKAYRLLKNAEDAEDAVLDLFVHLWDKSHKWNPEAGYFRAYLNIVARNFLIDVYRKKSRESRKLPSLIVNEDADSLAESVVDPTAEPLGHIVGDETNRLISNAISDALLKLHRPNERLAWMLYHFHKYPLKDVARIMDSKEGSIKVWIYRASHRMRPILEKIYEHCKN